MLTYADVWRQVPYWFSAMTMRSVGEAANAMVLEIARYSVYCTDSLYGLTLLARQFADVC
jgi:hypothetical protein